MTFRWVFLNIKKDTHHFAFTLILFVHSVPNFRSFLNIRLAKSDVYGPQEDIVDINFIKLYSNYSFHVTLGSGF